MSEVIELTPKFLLGSGNERICYVHPNNARRCIKIYHSKEEIFKHTRVMRQQNEMEAFYFKRLMSRNVPFVHLPKFYGWVETTQGKGLEFERVVNEDGTQSKTLVDLLEDNAISREYAQSILEQLGDYLRKYSISICDTSPDHIFIKQTESGDIPIIIDGVGSRYNNWKLYLLSYLPFFARRKTEPLWQSLTEKILHRFNQ